MTPSNLVFEYDRQTTNLRVWVWGQGKDGSKQVLDPLTASVSVAPWSDTLIDEMKPALDVPLEDIRLLLQRVVDMAAHLGIRAREGIVHPVTPPKQWVVF